MQLKSNDEQQENISGHLGTILMFLVFGFIVYIFYTLSLTQKSESIQLIQNNKWEEFSVSISDDLKYSSYLGRQAYTIQLPISKDQYKYIECKTSKIKPLCQQLKKEQTPSITRILYYKGFLNDNKYQIYLKGIYYNSKDGTTRYYEHRTHPPYQYVNLSHQYAHLTILILIGLVICFAFSYLIAKYELFPKHFKVKLIVIIFAIWLFHVSSAIIRII